MTNEFEVNHQQFRALPPKGKIHYIKSMVDDIVLTLNQKQPNIDAFVNQVALFKTLVSSLYRLSGVYKKEYFDFLVYSIRKMWFALEKCSSQFLLYPALSSFIELFNKLKGLNPYYTLHATLNETIEFGKLPPKDEISELLSKEKQNLTFLIDYMQLDSVLRLNLTKEEKINIVKSATNYAQLLVLTLYNFLVTVPVIPKEDFLSWCKLFEETIEKARLGHHYLKELEETEYGLLRIKISESSLFSLKAQLHLLSVRYLNENVEEFLNLATIENSRALQQLEPFKNHPQYSDIIRSFYFQQKSLLLETRFYQIINGLVKRQYKNTVYVGDRKDEKPELTKSIIKFEVDEILSEIEGYINTLIQLSRREDIGICFNLINIYAKITFGSYVYDLADNLELMEELVKTQSIDIGDPELSLLLARYWLFRWSEKQDDKFLKLSQNYYERSAEVFQMLYNNRYVPIYSFCILAIYQLYLNNLPKADFFIMKADDEYTEAKLLMILNESEQYYYERFREQIDVIMKKEEIEKPLRFSKPFNPLDYNSWSVELKDWRKNLTTMPEPFPFHLDQLKILEFEFISPNSKNNDSSESKSY